MAKSDFKNEFQSTIDNLKNEIKDTQDELNFSPSDFFPDTQDVNLDLQAEVHDYEQDLEAIREDSKDTLECIANLYLDENTMNNKNINKIINNDALALSDLKFSISCSKRGLINLMRQIDGGNSNADLYQSVSMFQREMKEGIQMLYKLQKDMKNFFKELKGELREINVGDDEKNAIEDKYAGLRITDKDINKSIDDIMKGKK